MHTSIQFDVNREIGNSFLFSRLNQFIEQVEAIDFRLQLIVEHCLEGSQFRIHDDDGAVNACLAKFGAFIGYGHGQVIHPMILQGLGHFVRTGSVCRRLHHTHHLGIGLQLAPIVIQVINQGIQIDFENGFVHLQLQAIGYVIEMKAS